MKSLKAVLGLALTLLSLLHAGWSRSALPDLALAERQIREGNAASAYQLLAPFEVEQAGQEAFDYLLGLAALESGQPDKATLVFERVLAANPDHAAARLDMGRAYFALGDLQRARSEIETAQRFSPPPSADATARHYLDAIAERERLARPHWTSYLEAGVGHDSNVNFANSAASLYIPLFGVNFSLAPNSVRRADYYTSVGGGVQGFYPIGPSLTLLASGDLRQKINNKADTFDFQSGDIRAGAQYALGASVFRGMLGHNHYELDNTAYRDTNSAIAEWIYRRDERTEVTAFAQDARIRYLQALAQINGANLLTYGVGMSRALGDAGRLLASAGMFGGTETATDGRPDGNRRLLGFRAGLQYVLSGAVTAYASISQQRSHYALQNPIFLLTRLDSQQDMSAGLNWQLDKNWSLRPQLSHVRNNSPVPINQFDRYDLSISIRRDFH